MHHVRARGVPSPARPLLGLLRGVAARERPSQRHVLSLQPSVLPSHVRVALGDDLLAYVLRRVEAGEERRERADGRRAAPRSRLRVLRDAVPRGAAPRRKRERSLLFPCVQRGAQEGATREPPVRTLRRPVRTARSTWLVCGGPILHQGLSARVHGGQRGRPRAGALASVPAPSRRGDLRPPPLLDLRSRSRFGRPSRGVVEEAARPPPRTDEPRRALSWVPHAPAHRAWRYRPP